MMKIRDVRNIIMTIMPQEEEASIIYTINHMFEKIIIHKINDIDSYVLNYLFFNNRENDKLKNDITISINNNIITMIRKQRLFFRDKNKKHKLEINDFNTFIVSVNKLIDKLIVLMEHIYNVNDNIKMIQIVVRNMIDIVLSDMSFSNCIMNYLRGDLCNLRSFKELFEYLEGYYYIVNIISRKSGMHGRILSNSTNGNIFKKISRCINNIPFNETNSMLPLDDFESNILINIVSETMYQCYKNKSYETKNIQTIYEFRDMVTHLKKWASQFSFLTFYNSTHETVSCHKIHPVFNKLFNKLKDDITKRFTDIITCNNLSIIQNFFSYYSDDINYIISNIDNIEMIMMSYIPENIEICLYYFDTLYWMAQNNNRYIIPPIPERNIIRYM